MVSGELHRLRSIFLEASKRSCVSREIIRLLSRDQGRRVRMRRWRWSGIVVALLGNGQYGARHGSSKITWSLWSVRCLHAVQLSSGTGGNLIHDDGRNARPSSTCLVGGRTLHHRVGRSKSSRSGCKLRTSKSGWWHAHWVVCSHGIHLRNGGIQSSLFVGNVGRLGTDRNGLLWWSNRFVADTTHAVVVVVRRDKGGGRRIFHESRHGGMSNMVLPIVVPLLRIVRLHRLTQRLLHLLLHGHSVIHGVLMLLLSAWSLLW